MIKNIIVLSFMFWTSVLASKSLDTWDYGIVNIEVWQDDLIAPWSLSFISQNHALITEQGGKIWQVIDNKRLPEAVKNTPVVKYKGQGGMLAVAVDPNYIESPWIYLAFSSPLNEKASSLAMTRIERGKIINNTWRHSQVLFEAKAEHYSTSSYHFGSRIVFDKNGHLYFSIGDRGQKEQAQSLDTPNGKIHRINKDGSIPADNPFLTSTYPSIYTYGNRNAQGLAMHPVTGGVWSSEHGPQGGDELNLIKSGINYGWPEITYGINYSGTPFTKFVSKPAMQQPVYFWRPSIAVSNIAFYQGDLFSKWTNKLLVTALKDQQVSLLSIDRERVMHEEVIFKGSGRVRDVAVDKGGAIYIVLNSPDRIVKLRP